MAEEDEIKKYQFGGEEEGEFEEFESDEVSGEADGVADATPSRGIGDPETDGTGGQDDVQDDGDSEGQGDDDGEGQEGEGEGEGEGEEGDSGDGEGDEDEGEQEGEGESDAEGDEEGEGEGQGEGEDEQEGEGEEGEGQGQGDEGDEEGEQEGQESEQEMPPPPQDMPEMPSEPPPDDRVNSLALYYVNNLFFQQTDEDLKLVVFKLMWSVGLHDAYQALERNAIPDTIWIDKEYQGLDQIVVKRLMYMIEANRDVFPKGASFDLERYFFNSFKSLLIQYSPTVMVRRIDFPYSAGEFRASFDKIDRNVIEFTIDGYDESNGWRPFYTYKFVVKETERRVDYKKLNKFETERAELGAMRHVIFYLGWMLRKKELELEGIAATHDVAGNLQIGYPDMNETKLRRALKFLNALA